MQDLEARTLESEETVLSGTEIGSFASQLTGDLIRTGDEAHDEARAVWNGMIDRHPALVPAV
ncbi:hypothetical protein ACFLYD_00385 [Chloroflexota bacterium]